MWSAERFELGKPDPYHQNKTVTMDCPWRENGWSRTSKKAIKITYKRRRLVGQNPNIWIRWKEVWRSRSSKIGEQMLRIEQNGRIFWRRPRPIKGCRATDDDDFRKIKSHNFYHMLLHVALIQINILTVYPNCKCELDHLRQMSLIGMFLSKRVESGIFNHFYYI